MDNVPANHLTQQEFLQLHAATRFAIALLPQCLVHNWRRDGYKALATIADHDRFQGAR
jgi:hypothetical protein